MAADLAGLVPTRGGRTRLIGAYTRITIEITKFSKNGGPLTKRIWLKDGKLVSDGSECVMVKGSAQRVAVDSMRALADLIAGLKSSEAIALGALREDLPDQVEVVTKEKLAKINGVIRPDLIARTAANISFTPDAPALALFDHDSKGMPASVAAKLEQAGGFWAALEGVLPGLAEAARVIRNSTSSGLSRSDTGKPVLGSDGVHVYVVALNGDDIDRFLKTLHDRCWLAGLGWMMVGAGGQLLERSIVDRMVGAPERLVFEGPPILQAPLKQDKTARQPVPTSGYALDTAMACPPLTVLEQSRLDELKAREAGRLAPELKAERLAFIDRQVTEMAARTGKTEAEARKDVQRWCEGVLHPDVVLPFDDADLAGKTVGDVLADPESFELATLADPAEGVAYGRGKAKIFRRRDGTPWINSFAHGRTIYELRYDAASVRAAMEAAASDAAKIFVALSVNADLDAVETEELRQLAKQLSGSTLKAIDGAIAAVRGRQLAQAVQETRTRQAAARTDPRPHIGQPFNDEPWLPVMDTVNDVIEGSSMTVPPVRDIDSVTTRTRRLPIPNLHVFTQANEEDDNNDPASSA
jgi:hypothetical protein